MGLKFLKIHKNQGLERSLFKRDYEGTRQVYDDVAAGAEWVVQGEGVATVKIDGTSTLVQDGKLYKRYDAKKGKTPPDGFIPAQEPDSVTGHWPGWVAVQSDNPADRWHNEAFADFDGADGTYEPIGPKVQGNPHNRPKHELVKHGDWRFDDEPPRDFDGLKAWFETHVVEGVVWHRGNGDMVKIKRRDFGLKWPVKA